MVVLGGKCLGLMSPVSLLSFAQVIKGSRGSVLPENLDFFGHKEEAPLGSGEEGWGLERAEEQQEEDGIGRTKEEVAGKRKRSAESSKGKRKKKKTQGISAHLCLSLVEHLEFIILVSLHICRSFRSFYLEKVPATWVFWLPYVRADSRTGPRLSVKALGCGCHSSGIFICFSDRYKSC